MQPLTRRACKWLFPIWNITFHVQRGFSMKAVPKILLLCLAISFFSCLSSLNVLADEPAMDGYIFKLKEENMDAVGAEDRNQGGGHTGDITAISPEDHLYSAKTIADITDFADEDNIAYIEPDYMAELYDIDKTSVSFEALTHDPYSGFQWYLSAIQINSLWELGIEGQDMDVVTDMDQNGSATDDPIVIAVIDSGMTENIEDIDYSRILAGKNVLEDSSDITDDVWHGTFVTGMLAAVKNNQNGIAGLVGNTCVMPIKAFSANTTSYSNIIKGICYAIEQKQLYTATNGAEGINVCVINMSLGGTKPSQALKEACESAMNLGIIIVCAAGNKGNTAASFPAQYTMGVGSVGKELSPSSFSQYISSDGTEGYQKKVWVCAPGEEIYSYNNAPDADGSYVITKDGTSFSCPIVSALASILKGRDNHLNQIKFMEILKDSASYITGNYGTLDNQDCQCGYGLVNFSKAYELVTAAYTGEHTYKITEQILPGCETEGYITKQCTVCGVTDLTTLDALKHSYQKTVIKPTYTSEGYTIYVCSRCRARCTKDYTSKLSLAMPVISDIKNNSRGICLTWKKVTGASGYTIYRKNGSSWKKIKTIAADTCFWTDTCVKNGSAYCYKIQAFAVGNVSAYSNTGKMYYLTPVAITHMKGSKKGDISIRYERNIRATGYRIEYSRYKSFKSAKTYFVKSCKIQNKTIRKLSPRKGSYVRIAAYKKVNGVRYYSSWKKAKVKFTNKNSVTLAL